MPEYSLYEVSEMDEHAASKDPYISYYYEGCETLVEGKGKVEGVKDLEGRMSAKIKDVVANVLSNVFPEDPTAQANAIKWLQDQIGQALNDASSAFPTEKVYQGSARWIYPCDNIDAGHWAQAQLLSIGVEFKPTDGNVTIGTIKFGKLSIASFSITVKQDLTYSEIEQYFAPDAQGNFVFRFKVQPHYTVTITCDIEAAGNKFSLGGTYTDETPFQDEVVITLPRPKKSN